MEHGSALSVSQAMSLARGALETVRAVVVGEVSEVSDKPGYKAVYFSLRDEGAVMPCIMWRDAYRLAGVEIRCGMLVQVTGCFSLYAPKGRMQFVVGRLELAGEGVLRMRVAELARRLEAEGLMASERKRPLPRFPERIAVVTSPRGKAIHDVMRTLKRRYPLAELVVAGVQVEGDGAVAAIIDGLNAAWEARPDVVLLVRGGGSYEDLMPFNDEMLARTIAASPVPVVTGIGHEPDTTIADMVADVRASTPTAAAEAAAPSRDELIALVDRERRALGRALVHRTERDGARLHALAERPVLRDPFILLGAYAQAVDLAAMRLSRALPDRVQRTRERLVQLRERLVAGGPRILDGAEARVRLAAARIHDLSPLQILGRGYSASFLADGRTVIRSVAQVAVGDRIVVRVADGRLGCTVGSVEVEGR